MKTSQIVVLRIWLLAMLAVSLFPPCLKTTNYVSDHPDGYQFLFNISRFAHVDAGRLMASWGTLTCVAALIWSFCDPRFGRRSKMELAKQPDGLTLPPELQNDPATAPAPGFPGIVTETSGLD